MKNLIIVALNSKTKQKRNNEKVKSTKTTGIGKIRKRTKGEYEQSIDV